jgi:hypothetical protein
MRAWILGVIALTCAAAFAQPAGKSRDGERAARPDSASNARVGGWCDALTGEKKEQCLREERRKKPDRSALPTKQAGAEVDAKPSAGRTAAEAAKSQ